MMNLNKHLNDKVEATLQSLDKVKRAEAPAFLFTRIQAALREENNAWELILRFLGRPAAAFSALFLILLLNGSILAWKNSVTHEPIAEEIRQEFAEEYNLAVSTFYDYESR